MALWQQMMIGLARSGRVTGFAHRQRWLQGLADRFVGGRSVEEAVERAADLARDGIAASLFYLGEYVSDPAVIAETVDQLTEAITALAQRDLDVAVSVDPTQVGLMIDEATCIANARILAVAARAAVPSPRQGHDAVMIDMEDASVTEATLRLHQELRAGLLPVAVTIQAYLHRTLADLDPIVAAGTWVRLVKGAFAEPADVAARQPVDIASRYRQCMSLLLSPAAREAGGFTSFATHDHRLIQEIIVQARANGWPADGYEFEMLHGVRPDLQRQLAEAGHRVRVYLPFGTDWFPYAVRRIGESPANLRFAITALTTNPKGGR